MSDPLIYNFSNGSNSVTGDVLAGKNGKSWALVSPSGVPGS